jgi:hypothetical protein
MTRCITILCTVQSMLMKRLIVLVNYVYWVPLRVIEKYILSIMPSIRILLNSIGDFIVLYVNNKLRICILIVIAIVLPRVVVAVYLMEDVMVHQCISRMYSAIPLLCIPILFNTVVGMVKHEAQHSIQSICYIIGWSYFIYYLTFPYQFEPEIN